MKFLLIFIFLRIYRLFISVHVENKKILQNIKTPVIYAFWHECILFLSFSKNKSRKIKILISTHRDGRMASGVIKYFKIGTIGGSSNREPQKAFREMLLCIQKGYDIGITPDGPKGPRRNVKIGIIKLAYLSKVPIIPIVFCANKSWNLNSWDKFVIPKPFSKIKYRYLQPIYVTTKNEFEQKRKELQEALNIFYENGCR